MKTDEPILCGKGLTKHYGGVIALDGVDIHVAPGEILALVGPNGAGKTTLVDLITGAQTATAGQLQLDGQSLTGGAARRARAGLARTFQHPQVSNDLTVVEAITAGAAARNLHSPWAMILHMLKGALTGPDRQFIAASELAKSLGIRDLDQRCSDLSLGEQRLLEVVRALAQQPRVMLLDEPFAGADPSGISGIIDAIRTVQHRGQAVILVDHNVDLIADLADRVMLLSQGTVVFDGEPAACVASKEMKQVYFGGEGSDD